VTTLRVLGLHGIGDHHTDPSWKEAWSDAIEAALRRWDPSLSVECELPVYDDLFSDPRWKLDPLRYAQAVGKMTASGVAVGLETVGEKIGDAFDRIGDEIGSWFRPSRDLSALPDELRWTAGMVVQWADYDELRKAARAWLAKQLADGPFDVVVAHSLGSLVAYDTFIHGQALLAGATSVAFFGSQVGNPFVRDTLGGYLVPLEGPRAWFQLFNPNDRCFSAPIRVPADPKFRRVATPFRDGFLSHDAVRYLSHPEAAGGFWRDVVAARPGARGFAPIRHALAAFDATLAPAARDRKVAAGKRAGPNRRALLVGINDYPDPANRLDGCVNDVFLISAALQESGFKPEEIRVVFDGRATTQGILDRMHWLLDGTRDGDERVLFYSGHGAQIPGYGSSQEVDHLKECLVPHDFDWTEEHAITDAQLAELYSQLPYESRFVAIFDCCHSGGLSRDGGAKVRGITPPDDVRHRALRWDPGEEMWVARDFKPITSDRDVLGDQVRRREWIGASGASYRLGRGMGVRSLDRVTKKAQRDAVGSKGPFLPMILEACAEQELAYEYRHGVTSYGAFTFSLTKELRDARHAPGRKGIDFVGLMKKTTTRLHRLDYDQTPALVGPTALTRVAIPWTKGSAR
jgi:hypothetical protein